MISEVTFAKKFTSFWNETLPNAKNYVRLMNGGLITAEYHPLPPAERKNNTALVNVLAFQMLRRTLNKTTTAPATAENYFNSKDYQSDLTYCLGYISRFSHSEQLSLPLSKPEQKQAQEIFKTLYARYGTDKSSVTIDPNFDGCGFINKAQGDILHRTTLVEVKSGERRFGVSDLRQVITYLALNQQSRKPLKITHIELFNPRMGISFSAEIESLCNSLSATSSQELFSEIQKFIVDNNFIEDINI